MLPPCVFCASAHSRGVVCSPLDLSQSSCRASLIMFVSLTTHAWAELPVSLH